MEYVEVTLKLPKESLELAKGTKAFLLALKKAVDDGFQVGADVPAIISAAISDLVPAMEGSSGIAAEAAADPVGVGQAFEVMGVELARELTKPAVAESPSV